MGDAMGEGKKTEVLARVERLRELIEEDVDEEILGQAYREIGRSLDGYTRIGRAQDEPATDAASGESPPSL